MQHDTIKTIENILAKGDRVELIPVKDGVRVVRIRREPINAQKNPAADVCAPKITMEQR